MASSDLQNWQIEVGEGQKQLILTFEIDDNGILKFVAAETLENPDLEIPDELTLYAEGFQGIRTLLTNIKETRFAEQFEQQLPNDLASEIG